MHVIFRDVDRNTATIIMVDSNLHREKILPSERATRRMVLDANRPQTIIDIQAKLVAGKGEGYRRWATIENLKRMDKTNPYIINFLFSIRNKMLNLSVHISENRKKKDIR